MALARECNGTPLQYSCLENPMDWRAWKAAVHEVAEGRTRLSDFNFTFHFHALEKEMATHSSVHAWRIPGMGKPGRLPSMGSHRVGHDWSDLAIAIAKRHSQWLSIKPRIKSKLSGMAFRTLYTLLPGYTVHLVPYSAAPCSCLQPGSGLAGPRGAQAYTCSGAAGDTLSPGVEKAPLLTSLRSLLKCYLTHPKTLPSFSSLLSLTLLLSSEDLFSLSHT